MGVWSVVHLVFEWAALTVVLKAAVLAASLEKKQVALMVGLMVGDLVVVKVER